MTAFEAVALIHSANVPYVYQRTGGAEGNRTLVLRLRFGFECNRTPFLQPHQFNVQLGILFIKHRIPECPQGGAP